MFLNQKRILEKGTENIESLRIKTPSIDEIVGQLSGGNQQKVVIGKWVNTDAEIFIFDEPTTGLHFHDINTLMRSFDQLIGNGHTVVIIEHNLDVIKCADHIIDLGPFLAEKRK